MMPHRTLLPWPVLVVSLLSGIPHRAAGQQPAPVRRETVPDLASCPACRLELRHVVTLSIDSEPGLLDERPWAVQRLGSSYALTSAGMEILWFDSTGTLVRTGRRGKGPGEFISPLQLLNTPNQDTLLVIDPVNARLTALDPRGEYLTDASFPATRAFDAALLPSGRIVLNAMVRDPEHIGFPLHRVGRGGGIERSFGATSDFRYDAPPLWRRRLAVDTDGTVWAAQELAYALEEWDGESGAEIMVLTRDSRLFPKGQRFVPATPTQVPPTFVSDVAVDSRDRLWVLITVPDSNWRAGLGSEQRTPSGVPYYLPSDFDKLHDTVIEIIEPATKRVWLRTRLPQYLLFLLGNGLIAGYRTREEGPAIDVYTSKVVQP